MTTERSFFGFTASRPVAITMLVAAFVVFGLVGYSRLPVNLLPAITHPTVTIRTEYPGASPQDVEERVSERIQEQVGVINGVQRAVSISRPGVSDVLLTFAWGTPMVFAVSDIRERLDRVFLPSGTERPLVLRYDPSLDPVLTLGLTGKRSLIELRHMAEEEIERELSQIDGVAAVKVRGGEEEEIRIAVDEQALTLYGLDIGIIGQRLAAENLNSAAGVVEDGKTEYLVRALNEFENLDEIRNVILERRADVSIRLEDVAKITRVSKDREVISRIDGKPCVLIDVFKEAEANIVQLCATLRERIYGTAAQKQFLASGGLDKPFVPTVTGDDAKSKRLARLEEFRHNAKRRAMQDFLDYQFGAYGANIELLQDQSLFISDSIDDVKGSAAYGGLFAILVIYLFLRQFRATAILFVSIPVSLIATFAPMFVTGIDLNIMSLGGLALGVGMLVDNSIVVLESITRSREEGADLRAAAVQGVSRVASAVIASTLTTVAVFFPIVFVEGVAGQLFRDQALTVVYALLMSLLAALFVIPMLAARKQEELMAMAGSMFVLPMLETVRDGAPGQGNSDALPGSRLGRFTQRVIVAVSRGVLACVGAVFKLCYFILLPFTWTFDRVYQAIATAYPPLLKTALRLRIPLLIGALALLAFAGWRATKLGSELLPKVHQGEFYLDTFLPRDATVERNDEILHRVEREIAELPSVRSTFLASGVDKKELNDSDQGEHSSRVLIKLHPHDNRAAQEEIVRNKIRRIVRQQPEIRSFRFAQPSVLAFNAPVVVEVFGRDVVELRRACEIVKATMERVPGLRDVRSTLQRGNTEISIELNRDKVAALELDSSVITTMLQNKVQGEIPTLFAERERKIDMLVRVDRDVLNTLSQLRSLNVNPSGNPAIPLETVAILKRKEGPSEIRRIGNSRGAEVRAALSGFDMGSTTDLLEAELAGLELPRGITAEIGGQKEEREASLNSLLTALLLAVFLVYIVMASQFENMIQPFVILLTLPLALVGVVIVLEALDVALSVVVFLGAIVLAGIVVNNAIILIDQINRLRSEGQDKLHAIVEGAKIRLRPVLMTTLTTVLGLLPLTGWIGGGEGLELRAPMAIVVIAGLSVSTLLTLIVIPLVYSLADRRA